MPFHIFPFKSRYRKPAFADAQEIQPRTLILQPGNFNFNNSVVKPVSVQYRKSINYPENNFDKVHIRDNYRNTAEKTFQNHTTNDTRQSKMKRNIQVEAYDKFQEAKRLNQKPAFYNNRIEIMNNTVKPNNTAEKPVVENFQGYGQSGNNLTENNLFNYYSDRKDIDFVLLSARQR